MTRFETPGRLASWAGLSPGSNESAGRVKSTKTRPGNHYIKGALGVAALSIARHPNDSYLGARYKRILVRRGKIKAIVANEHSILTAAGTCSPRASATTTPETTSSPKKTPPAPKTTPSAASKHSATTSP